MDPLSGPRLGEQGEHCAACGAPLAFDQRYCLQCGERRAEARLPFLDILAEVSSLREAAAPAGPAGARPPIDQSPLAEQTTPRWMPPLLIAAVVATLAVVLAVGVMIGDNGSQDVAATQPVLAGGDSSTNVAAAGGTNVAITNDWAADKTGWTVQLQTLPKDGTTAATVAKAKSDAAAKGVPEVGVLLTDDFPGLTPGSYVVYSGQFTSEKAAEARVADVKSSFPEARAIEIGGEQSSSEKADPDALSGKKPKATVSRDQLDQLKDVSPEEYSKQSRKLPDETVVPGTPPPKDNKAPGGGEEGTTIQ